MGVECCPPGVGRRVRCLGHLLVVAGSGGLLQESQVPGEPVQFDPTAGRVALVARAEQGNGQLVRTSKQPWAQHADGPKLDHVYRETVRFSDDGKTVGYFALHGRDLVRVQQPAL